MVKGLAAGGKRDRFAAPPWTTGSGEWRALDERLPPDHLARRIADAIDRLDLGPLWDSYLGVGKKALRPDRGPGQPTESQQSGTTPNSVRCVDNETVCKRGYTCPATSQAVWRRRVTCPRGTPQQTYVRPLYGRSPRRAPT